MTRPRTALPLAALALLLVALPPALLPACARTSSAAPGESQAAAASTPAQPPAAAQQGAAAQAAPADKAAADKLANEQRAAIELAASQAQMRQQKQMAEAAVASVQAQADAAAHATAQAPMDANKGKSPEAAAAQNAAAIELASAGAVPQSASAAAATAPPAEDYAKLVAEIQTSKGSLVLEFFPDDAPVTVDNFVDLARKHFYDGLTFHRIIPGFLIEGGDPRGDGTGGSGHTLKAEWNGRKHKRGTLSMSRLGHPDSASSQFFICHQEHGDNLAQLDGRYTVFGQLIRGFDVLDAIAAVGSPSGQPSETVTMLKVIIRARQDSDREPGA